MPAAKEPSMVITPNRPPAVVTSHSEKTSNPDVWSPLQELSGVAKITSREPLIIEQVQISFEGESRVHTQSLNKEDQMSTMTVKSKYKFLVQTLDLNNFEIGSDTEEGIYFYLIPFRFIISKWATPKSGSAPGQCLALPPSFCQGAILTDVADATTYAQPLIDYNLRVKATLIKSDRVEGKVILQNQLVIPLRAETEMFPPYDTEGFSNDFVTTQSHFLRPSIFSFQKYTMCLTAFEPAPVLMVDDHTFETREMVIRVAVTASGNNLDTQAFFLLLQRIGFRIIPALRAKTYYSTQPFPKLPAQALLTVDGPHRLHDQVLKLEQASRTLSSWQSVVHTTAPSIDEDGMPEPISGHKTYPTRVGQSQSTEWQSEICFVIKVPSGVTPTFCSAIAARQYSVVILLKATGVNVKDFVLEVPVQLVSAPISSTMTYSSISEDGPTEIAEAEHYQSYQSLFEQEFQDDNEPLPRYQ